MNGYEDTSLSKPTGRPNRVRPMLVVTLLVAIVLSLYFANLEKGGSKSLKTPSVEVVGEEETPRECILKRPGHPIDLSQSNCIESKVEIGAFCVPASTPKDFDDLGFDITRMPYPAALSNCTCDDNTITSLDIWNVNELDDISDQLASTWPFKQVVLGYVYCPPSEVGRKLYPRDVRKSTKEKIMVQGGYNRQSKIAGESMMATSSGADTPGEVVVDYEMCVLYGCCKKTRESQIVLTLPDECVCVENSTVVCKNSTTVLQKDENTIRVHPLPSGGNITTLASVPQAIAPQNQVSVISVITTRQCVDWNMTNSSYEDEYTQVWGIRPMVLAGCTCDMLLDVNEHTAQATIDGLCTVVSYESSYPELGMSPSEYLCVPEVPEGLLEMASGRRMTTCSLSTPSSGYWTTYFHVWSWLDTHVHWRNVRSVFLSQPHLLESTISCNDQLFGWQRMRFKAKSDHFTTTAYARQCDNKDDVFYHLYDVRYGYTIPFATAHSHQEVTANNRICQYKEEGYDLKIWRPGSDSVCNIFVKPRLFTNYVWDDDRGNVCDV